MTLNECVRVMIEKVGGRWRTDRDGSYWEIEKNGFILEAEPSISMYSEGVTCGFDCALSHVEFARVANAIMGEKPDAFVCMHWFQKIADVADEGAWPRQIESQMVELVAELERASLDSYLEKFSAELAASTTVPQICHLAALAWRGRLERLLEYQEIFQRGHRMGFVPLITIDMIDRAVDMAAERAS